MQLRFITFAIVLSTLSFCRARAQERANGLWHGIERNIRYVPDGERFVAVNDKRRFNRALYGTNTGFRVEAGGLPQFALYLPGMGGSLKFGLANADTSQWLIDAERITARYTPGAMAYVIEGPMLGQGRLLMKVLAMPDADGLLVQAVFEGVGEEGLGLLFAFGGATGKRFHRDGDIGADPESSFYLKPEYCKDNLYEINDNRFVLHFGSGRALTEAERYEIQHRASGQPEGEPFGQQKQLLGTFPPGAVLRLVDAGQQSSPIVFYNSSGLDTPAIAGKLSIRSDSVLYFSIHNPETRPPLAYSDLESLFDQAEAARLQLAGRVKLSVPDPYINPFGGALAIAADAIWEAPTYLHGAVAWRMRLNGWRGAYVATPLGWHDRARSHFRAYALSQLDQPSTGPVTPDTALNFARQKEVLGTALFSSGYICRNPGGDFRAHHYDMNLVFIDQLLRYLRWTGDMAFAREMWPVLVRHLDWEKRCFDDDGDGLYDAYCAIWASDALEYSGGGVTHASAYNFLANKLAAELAVLIGEAPEPYRLEAEKIRTAVNNKLWMPGLGRYAEYKDILGNKLLHPAAGLWTVYHAIDSELPEPFQAYQALRYVDTDIPHIPIRAGGLPDGLFTLSTTNWMPYTWSVNNVAMAEVLHTALAYWQAGRNEEAFGLWKSAIMESMYLGASPGSFQQLSFYDAFRGELYRDFADPVGIAARTLVEGLFGIRPDALEGVLAIQPGFPDAWERASLALPDISFHFEREGRAARYLIRSSLPHKLPLLLKVKAMGQSIRAVTVNGKAASWKNVEDAIGFPMVEVRAEPSDSCEVVVEWEGAGIEALRMPAVVARGEVLGLQSRNAAMMEIYDPQGILNVKAKGSHFTEAIALGQPGHHTFFVQLQQGALRWWSPVNMEIRPPVSILPAARQSADGLLFRLQNNTASAIVADIRAEARGDALAGGIPLAPGALSEELGLLPPGLMPGPNIIRLDWGRGESASAAVTNWSIQSPEGAKWETVDLSPFFNDSVTQVFKHQYLAPRAQSPTVQIPLQGVGNWCYPLVEPDIDDTGLRSLAGADGVFELPQGIPFATPGPEGGNNVIFTSLWDNFPASVTVPLSGGASRAYLLVAGSTNAMQSRMDNGLIDVEYMDGAHSVLPLRNPENWWPIEQDYYLDGFAFDTGQPPPPRVHLKTGLCPAGAFDGYVSLKGYSDRVADGGAATVLCLPLVPDKKLKQLTVKTLCNEVIVGLMALTLVR